MKILPMPAPLERETPAAGDRQQDRGALGSAFEGALAEAFEGNAREGAGGKQAAQAGDGDKAKNPMETRAHGKADLASLSAAKAVRRSAEQADDSRAFEALATADDSAASNSATVQGSEEPESVAQDRLTFADAATAQAEGKGERLDPASVLQWLVRAENGTQAPAGAPTSTLRDQTSALALLSSNDGQTAAAGQAMPTDGDLTVRLPERVAPDARAAAALPTAPDEKSRVRLEVLRMETHYEPTSGEAVLVEGGVDGESAARSRLAAAHSLGALLKSTVGSVAGNRTTSVEPTGGAAGASDPAMPSADDLPLDSLVTLRQTVGRDEPRRTATATLREAGERVGAVANVPAAGPSSNAPTLSGAMMITTQVAERIVDAFAPGAAARAPLADPASSDAHLRMRAGGGALKTLTIKLQPETLGILNVSMRLVNGELTLELAASQADTARLLTEDKANLRSILEKAGFNVDDAAIHVTTREAQPAASSRAVEHGANDRPGSDGRQPGAGAGSERDGRGGAHPQEDSRSTRSSRTVNEPSGPSSRTPTGSVYL